MEQYITLSMPSVFSLTVSVNSVNLLQQNTVGLYFKLTGIDLLTKCLVYQYRDISSIRYRIEIEKVISKHRYLKSSPIVYRHKLHRCRNSVSKIYVIGLL